MKTIGSHPGAILFRLSIMVILIAILIMVFFIYIDDARHGLERNSILQTRRVIDSSLAVVFSTYAVRGTLDRLNEIDGGNPFLFLQDFGIQVAGYEGELEQDLSDELPAGWYYLKSRGLVAYRAHFSDSDSYFRVELDFEDNNQSGSFEAADDKFRSLKFVKVIEVDNRPL